MAVTQLKPAQPKVRKPRVAYETTGPAQLASQPAVAKQENNPVALNEWAILRQHLEARLAMLRAWRYSWAMHWQLLETYLLPRRGIFINPAQPTPNTMIRGQPINQAILDPTGTQAMRVCAAGLMSGLMSPGRPWFKLNASLTSRDNLPAEAQIWFEQVEERMYRVMARSNFYDSAAQMFEDLTTFGSGPQIIYEDERDVIRCYVPCPGEYYLASSSAMRVESMFRQFVMTVAQIVEMFGVDNCPRDIQELWRTKGSSLEMERLVAHAIEPNFPVQQFAGATGGVVKGGFTWREAYWVWGTASANPLSLTGFRDQPHVCPRWAVTSNDAYGRSVGMDVLPDIMQLQMMTARLAEAVEKMVRPPLLASVSLKNEPSSILPGHVTYAANIGTDQGMRPIYDVDPKVKEMMMNLAAIQQRVKTGFFNDLFLMLEAAGSSRMTAYEVAQRQQEKLQVLGPVVERFQNEYASPAIKRIFRIMGRRQLLPPIPDSLRGTTLDIEYVSAMALAQRAAATAAMEQFAKAAGSLAGIYPEARLSMNAEEWMREYGDFLNVPKKVINPPEVVAQGMAALQQQQQQQQQLQAGQAMVEGANTLANAPTGGGASALSMLLGTTPSGGGAAPAAPASQ